MAYFVGSTVKGPKLCPNISPNKTISGAIGGLVGGIIGAVLVCLIVHSPSEYFFTEKWQEVIAYAIIGLFGAILTELGDLVESLMKRKLGIKDMGRILPGHGGIMDRIDGLLFAAPLTAFVFCVLIPLIA
jgi:phosphatidate cytidylyltransferase